MSFFAVHLEELGQLRTRLQQVTVDMRRAAGRLQGASPGQLGTGGLDAACAEFGDTWGHGIDRIAAGSERITQATGRAGEAYAGAEQALGRMYGQAARSGGGNGDGSGGGS